ncbi:FkbM family methyltransferase [Sphingomonas segetis]|uniref:FkbM family methyltransferase n=1 Tax=Sphingomonas segetis TaxID=1104779 RepID=UPI0012D2F370|nr:FkbM family methyltransferase [Sphingomonas segetis]
MLDLHNPKSPCLRSSSAARTLPWRAYVERERRMTANIFKALLADVRPDDLRRTFDALTHSTSQLGQEIFVLSRLGWKRNGYYVEFGATDGRTLSNTWLVDRQFGWRGILAEPGRIWHDALVAEGRNAHVDFDCVWNESGQTLTFSETPYAELSTLTQFAARDMHDRSDASTYDVTTISLTDLLIKYDAPQVIDYLSIDTEGSELAILEAFDFNRYRFRCITCEHNFTPDRNRIFSLLGKKGYRRVYEEFSQFDDWYVHQSLLNSTTSPAAR